MVKDHEDVGGGGAVVLYDIESIKAVIIDIHVFEVDFFHELLKVFTSLNFVIFLILHIDHNLIKFRI